MSTLSMNAPSASFQRNFCVVSCAPCLRTSSSVWKEKVSASNIVTNDLIDEINSFDQAAVEAQAIDCAHRIGQRRTVIAHRLIARGTIEERILELQAKKAELADAILGELGRAWAVIEPVLQRAAVGACAEMLPLLMMRPPRGVCSFMILKASCVHRNEPVRLVCTTVIHCSKVRSSSSVLRVPRPALLNSTSSRPNDSVAKVTASSHSSSLVTSATAR